MPIWPGGVEGVANSLCWGRSMKKNNGQPVSLVCPRVPLPTHYSAGAVRFAPHYGTTNGGLFFFVHPCWCMVATVLNI